MNSFRLVGRRVLKALTLATLALLLTLKGSGVWKPVPASFFLRLQGDPEVKKAQGAAFLVRAKHPGGERVGTGMAVAEGFLLTAFHLLGDPATGEITAEEITLSQPHTGQKGEIPAEVEEAFPSLDLAVLKFEPQGKIPPLSFGDPSQLQPGEPVYLVGHEFFPGGLAVIYPRDGEFAGELDSDFLAIFPPVARGFSGGGVFNEKHEIVGIISRNFIVFETFREGGRVYRMTRQGAAAVRIDRCPAAICRSRALKSP